MREVNFESDVLPLKDKLFRLAWRITMDRNEAEDIVQETLLRVWARRGERSGLDNPEAFSMTICRNLSLDHMRRRATRGGVEELREGQGDIPSTQERATHPSPMDALLKDERMRLVREAMDHLPELQRTLMELRDMEGMTYREIASTLSLTETQVKVYLHRARTKIKTTIEGMDSYGL